MPAISEGDTVMKNPLHEDEEIFRIYADLNVDEKVSRAKSDSKKCFNCKQAFDKQAIAKSYMNRTEGKCYLVTNISSEDGVWKCKIEGCGKVINTGNNMR